MAEALAHIREITDLGMIQIRADLTEAGAAITKAAAIPLPGPTSTTTNGSRRLCWMSPDELLLVLPQAELAAALAELTTALAGQHALVLDVSDMRAAFAVEGGRADQVLAKLSPTDLAAMPADGMRRSRAAQVACGFWRQEGGFVLIGFRSVADYLRGLLDNAARAGTGLDPR